MPSDQNRELYRVYRAGGRIFTIYLEYDAQLEESYPAYPDFEARPEHTAEGRPFATSAGELPAPKTERPWPAAARRLRRLRLVLQGGDALRPHRRVPVRRAAARL